MRFALGYCLFVFYFILFYYYYYYYYYEKGRVYYIESTLNLVFLTITMTLRHDFSLKNNLCVPCVQQCVYQQLAIALYE